MARWHEFEWYQRNRPRSVRRAPSIEGGNRFGDPTRKRTRAVRPGIRRKAMGLLAATVLVITGAIAAPLSALAADGPYTINGTVPDDNTTELGDLYGNLKELGPLNSNTTKIGVIHADAVPTLGLTNPNGQVDLRRAWLDTERDSGTNHDWLYFAWERDANSGSGFIAYEFMQNAAPSAMCLRHGH